MKKVWRQDRIIFTLILGVKGLNVATLLERFVVVKVAAAR